MRKTAKWKTLGVKRETVKEGQPLFNVYRYFRLGDDWHCSCDESGVSVHRAMDYLLSHPREPRGGLFTDAEMEDAMKRAGMIQRGVGR